MVGAAIKTGENDVLYIEVEDGQSEAEIVDVEQTWGDFGRSEDVVCHSETEDEWLHLRGTGGCCRSKAVVCLCEDEDECLHLRGTIQLRIGSST